MSMWWYGAVAEAQLLSATALDGKVWLDSRASGSATVALAAAGKVLVEPRASGASSNPIAAAGTHLIEARASGHIPLILGADGKVWEAIRASGTTVQPIVAAGSIRIVLSPNGIITLGPLSFSVTAPRRARKVVRLEVWDKFKYAGGVCQGVFRYWYRGMRHRRGLNAESTWTVTVPGVPAFVQKDRILRIVYRDGSRLERIITDVTQQLGPSGELTTAIVAEHPIIEFGLRGQVRAVEASGRVRHRFERSSLTGREHLAQYAVQTMKDLGYTYWEAGVVERDRLVKHTYDGDNPAITLIAVRDDLGLELVVRDDGVASFYVDLVAMTGAHRPILPARYARQIGPVSVVTRLAEQATVIYPAGARGVNEERATPARARWRVRTPEIVNAGDAYRVHLQDAGELGFGPLRFTGQLVGKLMTWRGAGHIERRVAVIADNPAAQSVDLNVAQAGPIFTELAPGDLVGFLAADGTELTRVEVPGVAPLIMTLIRDEIPVTNNPLRNPALRHWMLDAAGVPVRPLGWNVTSSAGASLKKNVLPTFWETGGASAELSTRLEHEGMVGDVVELERGTAAFPWLAGSVRFWPVVGSLYLLLELFSDDKTIQWPIGLEDTWSRFSEETGGWVTLDMVYSINAAVAWWNERHPLKPIVNDFWAARLSVRQRGPTLVQAYIDRFQLTESDQIQSFAEGSGPAQLWHAGQDALTDYSGPAESVAVDYRDVAAAGGGEIPMELIEPGVRMAVHVPKMGLTRLTRVLFVDEDVDDILNSKVGLAGRPEELTERLSRGQAFTRSTL